MRTTNRIIPIKNGKLDRQDRRQLRHLPFVEKSSLLQQYNRYKIKLTSKEHKEFKTATISRLRRNVGEALNVIETQGIQRNDRSLKNVTKFILAKKGFSKSIPRAKVANHISKYLWYQRSLQKHPQPGKTRKYA